MKLLFKCENSKCDIILPYEDHVKHSETCDFCEILCEKCNSNYSKNEEKTHLRLCDIKLKLREKVIENEEASKKIVCLEMKLDHEVKGRKHLVDLFKFKLDEALKAQQNQDKGLKNKNVSYVYFISYFVENLS